MLLGCSRKPEQQVDIASSTSHVPEMQYIWNDDHTEVLVSEHEILGKFLKEVFPNAEIKLVEEAYVVPDSKWFLNTFLTYWKTLLKNKKFSRKFDCDDCVNWFRLVIQESHVKTDVVHPGVLVGKMFYKTRNNTKHAINVVVIFEPKRDMFCFMFIEPKYGEMCVLTRQEINDILVQ
jgi:hypothetical protein